MSNPKAYGYTDIRGAVAPTTSGKMSPTIQLKRSPSPVALGRSSFSSIRERDSDLAQTFTSTKISSYSSHNLQHLLDGGAIADEPCSPSSPLSEPCASGESLPDDSMMLVHAGAHPHASHLRDYADRQSDVVQSVVRSLAWLHTASSNGCPLDAVERQDSLPHDDRTQVDGSVARVDDADSTDDVEGDVRQPFETLPLEIYRLIIDHLILDTPPNGIDRRNVDLMSLLVTSRTLYEKTLEALYRRIIVPHSRNFQKFFTQLEAHPYRGAWVKRLDFSHFNPVSLFATASARAAARNLTAETLLRCLRLTPNLQEFLAQDYLDSDIDESVLRTLFSGLPKLTALDLCGCSSAQFRNAFASLASGPSQDDIGPAAGPATFNIHRLSLHKCITLPSTVFEFLLPKLGRLTHLDLAGTRVTDAALQCIPKTARITHLNLSKCSLLTPAGVIDFLASHPAVSRDSLVFLSLGFDASTFQLFEAGDVSRLLRILPATLKSLSLKGSRMDASHVPLLRAHAKHLEELALGRGLSLSEVSALVVPPKAGDADSSAWTAHELRYLDVSDMDAETLSMTSLFIDGLLLGDNSRPLEVVEVSDAVFKRVAKSQNALTRMGWRQSEIGARSWLVRGSQPAGKGAVSTRGSYAMENGQRPWKMGAQSWGMRKIPVAHAKVGGMYGSYMFGRKL